MTSPTPAQPSQLGLVQMSTQEVELLSQSAELIRFAKGEFITTPQRLSRYIYYITSGLLRQYAIDRKGKEHILLFAPEGSLLSDVNHICFRSSSIYYTQAIEAGEAYRITIDQIDRLSQEHQGFCQFQNRLLHAQLSWMQERITQLQGLSAEERYQHFTQHYADLIERIPQTMIASYLGIAPESLSRIRKSLGLVHQ